ncbi:MAG TPA: cobalamin biosynthesis protein [Sphingobium sp.]
MIVAGFGCRNGTEENALRAAFNALPKGPPMTALATLSHKAPLLAPLARALNLNLILIDPLQIEGFPTPTISPASLAAYRTGSVAEAVALIAAGPGATLLSRRVIARQGHATCALAQGAPA